MSNRSPAMALPMKIVYVVVAVLCLILGLVGLVMPVIPGVLFLAAALLLLGKVSRRIHIWSRRHPALRAMRLRMARLGGVSLVDRLRLAALMSLEMLVKGVDGAVSMLRKLAGKLWR